MVEFAIEGDVIIAGSRILVPISVATILPGVIMTVQGTVTSSGAGSSGTVVAATILNAPMVTVQGTVQRTPSSYFFTNVSATVKGGAGVLYSILLAGESGLVSEPGTLLVLDGTATLAIIPVAAGAVQNPNFGPGVGFSTLIGSIIGSVDATFVRS